MKVVKVWVWVILFDMVFFGLLVYGIFGGVVWVLSVFLFWMWMFMVFSIVFGLFGNWLWFLVY